MLTRKILTTGLAILLLLVSLSACSGLGSEASPTPTVEEATATVAPTEPPVPTDTLQPQPPTATQDAGANSGVTATAAVTQTPAAAKPPSSTTDKYTYLGQTISDHTQFRPNVTVTITWTVQNAGTTGWTTDYTLRYFAGPKAQKDLYKFSKEVGAGKNIDLTVTFTTPTDLGDYDMWFKLVNAQGQNFGDVDLVYTVTNSPKAFTPTPKK
jgi:hypothetical protein